MHGKYPISPPAGLKGTILGLMHTHVRMQPLSLSRRFHATLNIFILFSLMFCVMKVACEAV